MQTLSFFWYELKAAKRHVDEALAESQEIGPTDLPGKAEEPQGDIKSVPKPGGEPLCKLAAL